jgi:hypothetical protein
LRIWGIIREKVWLSKNILSPSERGQEVGADREKQVVEAVTHIETTGKCVREYGSVLG